MSETNGNQSTIKKNRMERPPVALSDHITVHTEAGSLIYQCNICESRYQTKGNFKNHLFCKTGIRRFICDICRSSFKSRDHLRYHCIVHSGPFQCKICMKEFSKTRDFTRHVNQVHLNIRTYKCEQCPKKFYSNYLLKAHLVMHSAERPFVCRQCGKGYKSDIALRRHSIDHSKRPFICYKCDMAFPSQTDLDVHLRLHITVITYVCNVCQFPFSTKNDLDRHLVVHADEKNYKCKSCYQSFKRPDYLKWHHKICDHLVKVHGNDSEIASKSVATLQNYNPYKRENIVAAAEKMHVEHEIGIEQPFQPAEQLKVPAVKEIASAEKFAETGEDLQPTRVETGTLSANDKLAGEHLYECWVCSQHFSRLDQLQFHENSAHQLVNEAFEDLERPTQTNQTTGVFVLLVPIPILIPFPRVN